MEDLSVPADRVSTIHNGIDDAFVQRRDLAPPDWWPSGRVALTVGRFKPQKNHLGLLAAIDVLEKASALSDWKFIFLGEGPLSTDIDDAIKSAGLENRIYVIPPQQDLTALYGAADLFILPSLYEGLSNALLEAAACGCPAAVTIGANEARIIDESRGYILTDPLEVSLGSTLSATDSDRVSMGRQAAAYVVENYSARKMARAVTAIYEDLAPIMRPQSTPASNQ